MPPGELEVLEKGLRSNRFEAFRGAAQSAVTMGSEGDRLLAEAARLPGWRGLYATAALGESRGPFGEPVLRDLVAGHGPRTSDVRCAALLALAKRAGIAASEALAGTVDDNDSSVRGYALTCLAAVGDARAWDAVLSRLNAMLSRQRKHHGEPSPVIAAVVYLARHAIEDDARLKKVAETLRKSWQRLHDQEQAWLEQYWPATHPRLDGEPVLSRRSTDAMHQYILQSSLFSGVTLV